MRPPPHRFAAARAGALAIAFALALVTRSGAIVPLHDRLACPDCGGGVNPHASLNRGDGDFEPDPTLAALRRLGVDVTRTRPLPGSATRPAVTAATPPAAPAPAVVAAATTPAVSTAATTAPASKPTSKPPETVSGYTVVSFSSLAGFKLPAAGTQQPLAPGAAPPDVLAQIPEDVRRLDGKKVLVTGFMLPTRLEDGFAVEFFLLSSPVACCYGTPPAAHEWIKVTMRKEGLPAVQHVPLPLAGRLRLRAQWDNGYLTGLYEIEGDGLLKPKR